MSKSDEKKYLVPRDSGRAGAYLILAALFGAAALADLACRCWP